MKLILIALASVILFFPMYWLLHPIMGANYGAAIAALIMFLVFPGAIMFAIHKRDIAGNNGVTSEAAIATTNSKLSSKYFLLAAVVTFLVSVALHQWLVILLAVWALLAMGGIVPWWSKYKKAFSIQWGGFLGLTLGLALLVWGPWEFYS